MLNFMALNTYIVQGSWIRMVENKIPGAQSIPTSSISEQEEEKQILLLQKFLYCTKSCIERLCGARK